MGCYKYVLIVKQCLKTPTEPICTDATAAAPFFPAENDPLFSFLMEPMKDGRPRFLRILFDMFQRLVSSARVTLGMWENHTEVRW